MKYGIKKNRVQMGVRMASEVRDKVIETAESEGLSVQDFLHRAILSAISSEVKA